MITTQFLNSVAEFVDGKVAKVVLNGTYEITSFEVKQILDSTLVLNYLVPVSEVSLITMVELKDVSNGVITSNVVNVPIETDTMMLQTIQVKEEIS
ncbi:hypothetical protein D3C78_890190 [compost metagenome]